MLSSRDHPQNEKYNRVKVKGWKGIFMKMGRKKKVGVAILLSDKINFKTKDIALAGVAQWTECQPVNQRVAGLFPSQGTWLGCGPGPQERT